MGPEVKDIVREARARMAIKPDALPLEAVSYACRISLGQEVLKKYDTGRGGLAPTLPDFLRSLIGKQHYSKEARDALNGMVAILGGSVGHYLRQLAQYDRTTLKFLTDRVDDSVTGTPLPSVSIDYLPSAAKEGYLDSNNITKEAIALKYTLDNKGSLLSYYADRRSEFNLSSAGHFLSHYLEGGYQELLPLTMEAVKSFEGALLVFKIGAQPSKSELERLFGDMRSKYLNGGYADDRL